MIIHIFGNPLLEFDNLPLKLKPELEKIFPKITFKETDPTENLEPENKTLFIIDTIENITKVQVLEDIDAIENSPTYSMHDLDLGLTLKLLKKIGQLEKAIIFGVPPQGNKEKVLKDLEEKIKQRLS
jgi:Ni,Fe-hydrogenase maturation factor